MRCLLGRRLGLSMLLRLGVTRGQWSVVIQLRVKLWDGLLVRMHVQAIVAWGRARGRRRKGVALRAGGLLAVCHGGVQCRLVKQPGLV